VVTEKAPVEEVVAVAPLTHSRSEVAHLDEDGVISKGIQTPLIEQPESAKIVGQDKLEGDS